MKIDDQILRDLLEDDARTHGRQPALWTVLAAPRWTGQEVARMWADFTEAVRDRDGLDSQTAEYEAFFDITDPDAPARSEALDVLASRVDDLFVTLLQGPVFPPLRAVA